MFRILLCHRRRRKQSGGKDSNDPVWDKVPPPPPTKEFAGNFNPFHGDGHRMINFAGESLNKSTLDWDNEQRREKVNAGEAGREL